MIEGGEFDTEYPDLNPREDTNDDDDKGDTTSPLESGTASTLVEQNKMMSDRYGEEGRQAGTSLTDTLPLLGDS